MKGRVVNYRIGPGTQNPREIIVVFDGVDEKELPSLVGKRIVVLFKGKEFRGKIVDTHGKRALRARMRRPIPGQALGAEVHLVR